MAQVPAALVLLRFRGRLPVAIAAVTELVLAGVSRHQALVRAEEVQLRAWGAEGVTKSVSPATAIEPRQQMVLGPQVHSGISSVQFSYRQLCDA